MSALFEVLPVLLLVIVAILTTSRIRRVPEDEADSGDDEVSD